MAVIDPTLAVPTRRATGAARWIAPAVSGLITTLFAVCAFRLSYVALTSLAVAHGVEPDVAWMVAVLVDGGAVVGTAGGVMAQWTDRGTGPYWLVVVAFAATSLGFNIVHSDRTAVGVAIAVTPPLAQLVATELLVRLLPKPAPTAAYAVCEAPPTVVEQIHPQRVEPAPELLPVDIEFEFGADTLFAAMAPTTPQTAADVPVLTFTAPTATEPDDGAAPRRAPNPAHVEAYERLLAELNKRPTAAEVGQLLGVGRSRGQVIRADVEAYLDAAA
ncbi:MAG: DUF2637 domain-containing protein [Thermoleophilia bacterium]|nr:DUF2637 domain-containing protein [Thermoleophilia bacterium]